MDIKVSSEFDDSNMDAIKKFGQVFTPEHICGEIIERLDISITETVCEPSVGKGIFVFTLLENFRQEHTLEEIIDFVENRLITFEIDENMYDIFKKLLVEYLLELGYDKPLILNNIHRSDFLLYDGKYDVIIGNPPYIRIQNMESDYREMIRSKFRSIQGNTDIYYAFMEKAVSDSTRFGFITPNSFIKNKSASTLRKILLPTINYLKDHQHKKIWSNISTYTAITICSELNDTFEWVTDNDSRRINKDDIGDRWLVNSNGDRKLSDLIYSMHGGIATLKDSAYIIDGGVEPDMCKKLIKATKNEELSIIYPYKNGKLMTEEELMKYPKCYSHLLEKREELGKRDKGKQDKYPNWYAYGRTQGLLREVKGIPLVVQKLFRKSIGPGMINVDKETLVISGIFCDVKPDKFDEFKQIMNSDAFKEFCEKRNNKMSDGETSDDVFLTVSSMTIREFTY